MEVRRLIDTVAWHDSVVHSISLIRSDSADAVVIDGRFLFDWQNQKACLVRLTLENCFRVEVSMCWLGCMSDGGMLGGVDLVEQGDLIDRVPAEWPK